jgi:hypothetical protein
MYLINDLVGDASISEDTADTVTLVGSTISGDIDVTRVTPRATPRVLDDESFFTLNDIITDSEDTVIKIVTAELLDNTTSIELEDELVGLDGNRDGLVNEGSLHGSNVSNSDVGISLVDLVSLGGVISALSVNTLVRIVSFGFNTVGSSVSQSISHQTTVATLVSVSITINELLFREGDEVLVVDEVEAFEGASGGESPAGTAGSLVLDGSDGTLSSPINGGGEVLSIEDSSGSISLGLGVVTSVHSTEFFSGQISKVVQSEGNIILSLVEFKDGKIVLLEDVESEFFFHTSGVTLLVGELPLGEEVSHESLVEGGTLASNEEDSEESDNFHFLLFKISLINRVLSLV